jgi:hypothetical protein
MFEPSLPRAHEAGMPSSRLEVRNVRSARGRIVQHPALVSPAGGGLRLDARYAMLLFTIGVHRIVFAADSVIG